jgi:p25-alpha
MSIKREKSELEGILFKVFMNYSVFGARYNMNYLRVQKFTSMCNDAGIIDNKLTPQSLDLLFRSINNRNPNMSFQTFLETTLRLAEIRDPQSYRKNPGEVYTQLITQHFLPLAGQLQEKREEVTDEMLIVSDDCKLILHSVFKGFKHIYTRNFPWELKPAEDNSTQSQKSLELLLREFDIYPALLTKNKIHAIWKDIVIMEPNKFLPALSLLPDGIEDRGECLTLSKFILFIYICSVIGYQDSQVVKPSNSEKLLTLLERIELSRSDPINMSNSLLPSGDVIQTIIDHEPSEASIYEIDDDNISCISLDQEGAEIADKYLPRLQSIFQVYCAYGDPLNIKQMKSSNLLKLLKNSGVLGETKASGSVDSLAHRKNKENSLITSVEVDLIFSRLTGLKKKMSKTKKITASIEFQQFLKTLELISKKIFNDIPPQEAFNKLLEEYVLKLEAQLSEERATNSRFIQETMEEFKSDEIIEALTLVQRSVFYYYKAYSSINLQMNFSGFIRFCKDFEIFPDIVSKSKLLRIFKTLAGISLENSEPSIHSFSSLDDNIPMAEDLIDDKLFVEALALISAEITYEDPFPGPLPKICWFIERLSQSSGPEKVLKTLGHNRTTSGEGPDMLALLKARYPEILDHSEQKKPTFNDLAFLVPLS